MTGAIPSRLCFAARAPEVEWLATDGARFTEPFFDQTLQRLRRLPANRSVLRRRSSLSELAATPPGVPLAGLIFHVSRCGSTLLTQMLGALPRHLVIAESPLLDDIVRFARFASDRADEERIALLRGTVAALGQPTNGREERLFVKLDCWSIFELPLFVRAFPGVPLIFVHRDPLEVLVSLIRRPSMVLIRDTVTPAQLGLSSAERDALSPEEHAAAILGAIYREATGHRRSLVPVAYEHVTAFACDELPGSQFSNEEKAALRAASLRDAKDPTKPFAADSAGKRAEATPALHHAIERWTAPHYRRWLSTLG